MRHRTLLVAATALALPLFTGGIRADDDDDRDDNRDGRGRRVLQANMAGANEVPPISTEARGRFRLTIGRDDTDIRFTMSWSNLTAAPAVSHIHFAPTKVAGGVMIFLCGGGGQPACPADLTGSLEGTITAANVTGPVSQGIPAMALDKALRAVRSGQGYVNLHTSAFPGGEIRGQIFD
jgi:CHRD domain